MFHGGTDLLTVSEMCLTIVNVFSTKAINTVLLSRKWFVIFWELENFKQVVKLRKSSQQALRKVQVQFNTIDHLNKQLHCKNCIMSLKVKNYDKWGFFLGKLELEFMQFELDERQNQTRFLCETYSCAKPLYIW